MVLEDEIVHGTVFRISLEAARVLILNGCLHHLDFPIKQEKEIAFFRIIS